MDVTVDRALLLKELQLCAAVVEKRNTYPILSHALIEADAASIAVRATDLELTLITTCGASVRSAGGCAADVPLLSEILRRCSADNARLLFANDRLKIECGTAKFEMLAADSGQYPSYPDLEETSSRAISGASLTGILRASSTSITNSDAKFGLIGPVLKFRRDSATAYGTDGHRLVIAAVPLESRGEDSEGMLTRKAVNAIAKIFSDSETCTVSFGENNAFICDTVRTLVARRQDYTLMNFEQWREALVLAKPLTVKRGDLLTAIRRSLVTAPDRTQELRVELSRGRVAVSSAADHGTASDYIPADYSGAPTVAHFSGSYLVDALEVMPCEMVTLTPFDEPGSGWTFQPVTQPSDGERFAIVMNMTVK